MTALRFSKSNLLAFAVAIVIFHGMAAAAADTGAREAEPPAPTATGSDPSAQASPKTRHVKPPAKRVHPKSRAATDAELARKHLLNCRLHPQTCVQQRGDEDAKRGEH